MTDSADLLSLRYEELEALLRAWGEPAFRAGQLFGWLHERRAVSFSAMSNLPAKLRERLEQEATLTTLTTVREQRSADGTRKYLFGLGDGNCIETVAMRYHHGISVCVSSQVGCRMGCAFCASTKNGLVRSLTAGEILAQIYAVDALCGERVDSVVLMGIGEPLDNFDNVTRFCDLVTDARGYNLAGRSITLSTCGLVPRMDALAAQKRQLTLSISLHAPTDAQRGAIMPVNRSYPIAELMQACRRYFNATGRRISFEYAVIEGTNDADTDADNLAKLISGMGAHVNLIPVNPVVETNFRATRAGAEAFRDKLERRGVNATVRRTLGVDISAACGQLRRETEQQFSKHAEDLV